MGKYSGTLWRSASWTQSASVVSWTAPSKMTPIWRIRPDASSENCASCSPPTSRPVFAPTPTVSRCPRCQALGLSTPAGRLGAHLARFHAHAYFTHLYERLPSAITLSDLEALLPWN